MSPSVTFASRDVRCSSPKPTLCSLVLSETAAEAASAPISRTFHEVGAPLVTSSSKSGLPGITTPGTFHPTVFSTARRFTPPTICLLYFKQTPLMGFKELSGLSIVSRFSSDPKNFALSRVEHRERPKTLPFDDFIQLAVDSVVFLPSTHHCQKLTPP